MGLVGVANEAHANDFTDFQAAREPYERGNYAEAVRAFEALIPRLDAAGNLNLIQESRKYLGAAYLLVDPPRRADAEQQFERIVRADENQRMRAATFGESIVAIFEEVRQRVQASLRAEADAEAERERLAREAEIARLQADTARLALLMDLAQEHEVRSENSRWVAMVPFGAGQFQNGNQGLGVFFAVTEGVFAIGSIISMIIHSSLDLDNYEAPTREARESAFASDEQAWRITNWVTFSAFLATAVAGILEAQIRFVPFETETEQRDLPEDLLPSAPEPEVEVGISPFGASLTVTY